MNDSSNLLQAKGLTMRFGGVVAVDNVDFAVRYGELRCLIGPNGAGKSTFFKMLSGQLKPTSGDVLLKGSSIVGLPTARIASLGIGIKTQVPSVFDGMTVRDSVHLAAGRTLTSLLARKRTAETLERMRIPHLANRFVGELAHGQRQIVELAMVVAPQPDLILLDEPAAGMTGDEVSHLANVIVDLSRSGAVVVVEHDMKFIRRIAKIVTVFSQGKVLSEGPAADVLADQRVRDVYLEGSAMSLLHVEEIEAGYARIKILSNICFNIEDGEFLGILGHNGMGKSTLLKAISGSIKPVRGSIKFEGQEIAGLPAHRRARLGIGYVPQGRQIFANLSVRENLTMATLGSGRPPALVDRILGQFPRLQPIADRPGGVLSGGEQQILAIARCLCGEPRLLLLDEPTEGIQPSIRDEIVDTLRSVRERFGLTVLLVEQNVEFMRSLVDRVLTMEKGRLETRFDANLEGFEPA